MNKAVSMFLRIIGVLLVLPGAVWVLQGINVLPGSFMSGDPQWAVNGLLAIMLGAGLFWLGVRK